MNQLTLHNGKKLYSLDELTALWVYNEIFVDNVYLRHGIDIKKGDIVFDVGSNIGLFSLYLCEKAPDLKIYTFEPVKPIFEVLTKNLRDLTCIVKNYNIGLSDENIISEINYYPKVSADSAIEPFDMDLKVKKYVENYKEAVCKNIPMARIIPTFSRKRVVRSFLTKLYKAEKVPCQLRTLSEIIEENELGRIDLLKIDAENHERQVLNGVRDEDWKNIRQISMEVHEHVKSGTNLLRNLKELLENKGYTTIIGEEDISAKLGVYMIYAKKSR